MPVFPRLCPAARRVRDRHYHARHRHGATGDRAGRGLPGEPPPIRVICACRRRVLQAVRALGLGMPAPSRAAPPISTRCSGCRCCVRRRDLLFCLLPPTRLALGTLSAIQVPDASGLVQPDAKSRRSNRHRPEDRYYSLRLHRRTCRRRAARAPDRGRRHGGAGHRPQCAPVHPSACPTRPTPWSRPICARRSRRLRSRCPSTKPWMLLASRGADRPAAGAAPAGKPL